MDEKTITTGIEMFVTIVTIKRKKSNKNSLIKNYQPKFNNNQDNNNPSVSTYENHVHIVIGPRNVGKNYYILKILEKKQVTKDQFI